MVTPLDSVRSLTSATTPTAGSPSPAPTPAATAASAAAGRALSVPATPTPTPTPVSATPPPAIPAVPARRPSISSDSSGGTTTEPTIADYKSFLSSAITHFKSTNVSSKSPLRNALHRLPYQERAIVKQAIEVLNDPSSPDSLSNRACLLSAAAILQSPLPSLEDAPKGSTLSMDGHITSSELTTLIESATLLPPPQTAPNLAQLIQSNIEACQSEFTNLQNRQESLTTLLIQYKTDWQAIIQQLPKKGSTSDSFVPFNFRKTKFIQKLQSSQPSDTLEQFAQTQLVAKLTEIQVPLHLRGHNAALQESAEDVIVHIEKLQKKIDKHLAKNQKSLSTIQVTLQAAQNAQTRTSSVSAIASSSSITPEEARKHCEACAPLAKEITALSAMPLANEEDGMICLMTAEALAARIDHEYTGITKVLRHKPPELRTLLEALNLAVANANASDAIQAAQHFDAIYNSWSLAFDAGKALAQKAQALQSSAKPSPAAAAPAAAPGLKPQSAEPAAAAPTTPAAAPTTPAAAPAPALSTSNRASTFASFSDSNNPTTKASTLITQLKTPPKGQWNQIQLTLWNQIPEESRNRTYGKFYELATAESSPIKQGFDTYCRGLPTAQQWKAGEVAFLSTQSSEITASWNEVRAQAIQAVFSPSSRSDKK